MGIGRPLRAVRSLKRYVPSGKLSDDGLLLNPIVNIKMLVLKKKK